VSVSVVVVGGGGCIVVVALGGDDCVANFFGVGRVLV